MKRPLFVIGFVFFGGLLTARLAGFHLALIAAAVAALLFVLALVLPHLRHAEGLLAGLLAAMAAFSVFAARDYLTVQPLQQLDGHTVNATVWLTREETRTETAILYRAVSREGELPAGTTLMLWVPDGEDAPQLYNLAAAPLYLTATEQYRADGIVLLAWPEDFAPQWEIRLTDERPWGAALTAWRQQVMARAGVFLDGEAEGLLRGVCFGDKTELSRGTTEAFADAGLSHMLSVSGFHMSVITLGFFGLLCLCGVRRRRSALFSLPVPVIFAALTGFSYSALRAGLMCLLVLLATAVRRETDGRNSLGGAVLLILLFDPDAVYDLGFLLSVTATLGIVCVSGWSSAAKMRDLADFVAPPQPWHRRLLEAVWGILRITLTATFATMPILALTFGRLPLLSPVSNLLGEPAASVLVVCGCVGTLLACVPGASFLAAPFLLAGGLAAQFLLFLARTISSLPVAIFAVNHPYLLLWACAVPGALVFGWKLLRGRGLRLTAMLLAVALAASTLAFTLGMRGVTTLTATDLSGGAAVLLTRDSHHALAVTGESPAEEIAHFLSRQGIDRLDFLLYTEENNPLMPADIAVAQTVIPAGRETALTFWNDSAAAVSGGWLTLTLGDTRVLVAPPTGDAAALSAPQRQADLVVFDRTPPVHVTALSAKRGVVCCADGMMRTVTRAVPWSAYPIAVTAGGTVRVNTRGQGDCQ